MSANESTKLLQLSLPARIQQVERDIEVRRQLVNHRAIVVKRDLRQRLVSPAALLTYAGFGVAVGLMLRRQPRVVGVNVKSAQASDCGRTQPGRIEQLFANAFKIVAMARTLATILPAAPTHPPCPSTASNRDNMR